MRKRRSRFAANLLHALLPAPDAKKRIGQDGRTEQRKRQTECPDGDEHRQRCFERIPFRRVGHKYVVALSKRTILYLPPVRPHEPRLLDRLTAVWAARVFCPFPKRLPRRRGQGCGNLLGGGAVRSGVHETIPAHGCERQIFHLLGVIGALDRMHFSGRLPHAADVLRRLDCYGFQIRIIAVSGYTVCPHLKGHLRQRFYGFLGCARTRKDRLAHLARLTAHIHAIQVFSFDQFQPPAVALQNIAGIQVGDGGFYDLQIRRVCAVRHEYRFAQSSAQLCLVRCIICLRIKQKRNILLHHPVRFAFHVRQHELCSLLRHQNGEHRHYHQPERKKSCADTCEKAPKSSTFCFHLRPPPVYSRALLRS